MKKIVILMDVAGELKEAQLKIPPSVCQKVEFEQLKEGMDQVFGGIGIVILSIETVEEVRNTMNRRWDDPGGPRVADGRFV